MLLKYTDKCTLIPPVRHFAPRDFTTMSWAANDPIPDSIYRALQWRHKRAKSFDVYDFTYTDYHRFPSDVPTSWYTCKVRYYSLAKEGMFKVPANFEDNWKHEFDLLAVLGIEPVD